MRPRPLAAIALVSAPAWGGDTEPTAAMNAPDPIDAILAIEGDAEYGAYLGAECTACHSEGAVDIPAIDWMAPEDIVYALQAYRVGEREHQVMNMIAARLGDEEIAALAAFLGTAD